MKLSHVVIASKNEHKITEIRHVLEDSGLDFELIEDADWPEVDETEASLEGNALLKARAVRAATGCAVIADDTGLEVDALGGEPGVHSARYAGADSNDVRNVTKLLAALEGVTNRAARFRTVMVLIDETGAEVVVDGVMEGEITHERRGSNGFGYDPVFLVGERTFAEMSTAEKNEVSHRARALRALAEVVTGKTVPPIPQHLSIVTIGARDLPELRCFYSAWGWQEVEGSDDNWCAYDLGGCMLALYPVGALGEEAAPGVAVADGDWNGVTFAINFPSEGLLRAGFAAAVAAGATVVTEPVERFWGGTTGYVTDPEGNRWELGSGGPNPAPMG